MQLTECVRSQEDKLGKLRDAKAGKANTPYEPAFWHPIVDNIIASIKIELGGWDIR